MKETKKIVINHCKILYGISPITMLTRSKLRRGSMVESTVKTIDPELSFGDKKQESSRIRPLLPAFSLPYLSTSLFGQERVPQGKKFALGIFFLLFGTRTTTDVHTQQTVSPFRLLNSPILIIIFWNFPRKKIMESSVNEFPNEFLET